MRDYAELIARLKQSDDNCNAECCECSGECLTAANYLKTALEEFRLGDEHPTEITLVPFLKFEEPVAYLNDAVPCGGGFYVKNELVNTAYNLEEVTSDA